MKSKIFLLVWLSTMSLFPSCKKDISADRSDYVGCWLEKDNNLGNYNMPDIILSKKMGGRMKFSQGFNCEETTDRTTGKFENDKLWMVSSDGDEHWLQLENDTLYWGMDWDNTVYKFVKN